MNRILLWIPMYNCEKQITRVLKQLKGEAEKYISEVIIVNNRSTDDGENAVMKYLEKNKYKMPIKLLRNHENYGLGGSHKVAWDYAIKNKFDYVITLHGDDQGKIKDLLPFIKDKTYEKYDCLLGSRFLKNSKLEGYSKFRTFGNKVFNIIFSIVTRSKIKDLGAGLNMYNVNILKDKHYMKFADDLTFNYYGVFAMKYYHQTYYFFPLTWSEDDQKSNVKMISQTLDLMGLILRYIFNKKKFFKGDNRKKVINKYSATEIYNSKKV